ncbi:MAG: penicillin-binding transpeptidase domain-containing protein [Acidimicrobiales bacterium]
MIPGGHSTTPPVRRYVAVCLSAAVALSLAGCSTLRHSPPVPPSPTPTAAAFLTAWSQRSWVAMARLVKDPPTDLAASNSAALRTLHVTATSYDLGALHVTGVTAVAPVTESLTLAGFGRWTIRTALSLALVGNHWKIIWTPATIDPALGSAGHFAFRYTWPPRAAVLAADGTPISPSVPTSVVVGLYGSYIKSPTTLLRALTRAGASSRSAKSAITAAAASPGTFEPVFTVRWLVYERIQAALYPVPGVFFHAVGGNRTSTPAPLVGIVGSLGAITKSQLKHLGAPYTATSVVGQGGIEQADERRLAGSPGAVISAVAPSGKARRLATFPAKRGRAVRTTINLTIEQDAANALATAPNEAALVAIDVRTGEIVAAANTSQGSDLALEGEQPPGSTMKMITSTALIDKGLTPESPATCPSVINVDGENLHNAEANEGSVPNLLTAFTVSCNTAFIGLTMANLDYRSLHEAASLFRIGGKWNPGLPVFTGSVPVNDGQTDLAASAIGQGRVVLNPLDLAMVAADLDTGIVRLPWIAVGAPTEHAHTSRLADNLVSDLHEMMLSVVQSGTAAGTGLPQGTYAKTGTAEYGTTTPLSLDAWLAGFNGDIAFAMVDVDSPGDGGPVDGPVVAKFLDALGPTS